MASWFAKVGAALGLDKDTRSLDAALDEDSARAESSSRAASRERVSLSRPSAAPTLANHEAMSGLLSTRGQVHRQ